MTTQVLIFNVFSEKDSHLNAVEFLLLDDRVDQNVIIFGVDMSSSVHVDNKKKDIVILGLGLTQGLEDTTLTPKAQYSINFSRSSRRFCLSLHYNGTVFNLLMSNSCELQFSVC